MIERRVSRVVGELRPLRLRYQEALIRGEMRRLAECSTNRAAQADDGDLAALRRRERPLNGHGEPAGV
jgi:hypothetical protein